MRLICLILFFAILSSTSAHAASTFWPIQSIDTMKYSRDRSRDPATPAKIPMLVQKVADLHPTHIAIATPYDAEFYPILKLWVTEARKHGLSVWFRGNFSAWEGWFAYPKFTDPGEHHAKTRSFILAHPDLFAPGDIFTPAPEPENGGFGDPRTSPEIKAKFQQFLLTSYATCTQAFTEIGIPVACGYVSTNGDVAKILDPHLVQTLGNVVIDHYVKSPDRMTHDISELYATYHVPIIVGEYGAPIPDIHGDMTATEQAEFIRATLQSLKSLGAKVGGVNYWTAFDGSTSLYDNTTFAPKPAVAIIQSYYQPYVLALQATGLFGRPVFSTTQLFVHPPAYYTFTRPYYRSKTVPVEFSGKSAMISTSLKLDLQDYLFHILKH